jgi:serine phosphatase RsbU (regulator of sigma subunit)
MIFGFIVSITFYFLTTGYYTQLDLYEKGELEKLSGISKTTSIQIDGMQHQLLFEKYQKKDDIKSNEADSNFSYIQRILKNSQEINGIKTPIYTLVYDDSKKVFYYVVKSDNPNYRHEWKEFKPQHVDQYLTGGVVRPYTDENGTWLSSFSPIKNNKGEVVGLVQVDSQFDEFIQRTWDEIKFRGLISISIISVIGFLLLRSIRGILRKEEEQANEIMQSHSIIEQKNKDITDSINYAKRIQEGILPPHESINLYIPDSFLIFRPRDIVSGDFYWFAETKEHFLLATVDCTGHGVPGGFMSMIGHTLLNEIVNQKGIEDPGKILDLLDIGVKKAIKSKDETESKDGMDVALLSFTKDLKTVQFAGAFRPLLFMREGILSEYKANRFPIGAGSYVKTAFDTHTIHLQKGDALYIFSDGYADQIGGKGGKKFMTKQFKELIQSNNQLDMQKQGMVFELALDKWQGEQEQMDDILVIGIRI